MALFEGLLTGGAIGFGLGGLSDSGGLGDIFGDRPDVPDFEEIDITDELKANIDDNLAMFDDAAKLSRLVNQETQEQRLDQLRQIFPDFDDNIALQSEMIQSQLRGELPSDVVDSVIRNSAERSFAGGFGGSDVGRNLTARDLGLTSLQLQQQGFVNAQNFLSGTTAAAGVRTTSPDSMFLSPAQRINFRQAERDAKFNVGLAKAEAESQPTAFGRAFGMLTGFGAETLLSQYSGTGSGGNLGSFATGGGAMGGGGGGNLQAQTLSAQDSAAINNAGGIAGIMSAIPIF